MKEKANKSLKKKLKKLNFRNFKTSSAVFMIILSIFRISMVVYWIIAPVILAFAVAFDDGIRNLVKFLWDLILSSSGNVTKATDITIRTVAPIMWLLTLIIMLSSIVKPFFNKRTYVERAYLAFNYIFWPALFTSLIYGIYFTIPFYGKPGETITDPTSAAWESLQKSFSPFSGWMIALQCMHFIMIIFGVFSIFESIMVKKMKLDYSDFIVRNKTSRSLVNQVIEGKIEFGEFDPDEVDKEIKRVRNETIAEEKRQKFEAMQKAEEERLEKKNAKKQRKNKKRNKNKENT